MMKAMILAAGFGTRLRPLTQALPKPMFPVMNRPLLEHTLGLLRANGIRDITVNVHHLPEKIIRHFGDGAEFGVDLHFSREKEILGTAGGIKAAQRFLDGGSFLVINSDVLVEIDLHRVLAYHKAKGSCLTLVVRKDASPEQFDPIEICPDGRIVHFVGASSMDLPNHTTRVMFTGIQIMEPEIFSRIPSGSFCGTAEDIFPEMIRDGLPVFGYLHEKYWIDLGNRRSYLQAHKDALNGKLNLKGTNHRGGEEDSFIVPPAVLGRDCQIASGARIGPYAVLGDGCRVKEGAVIENSVAWNGVTLGAGARVEDSILGEGVVIPGGSQVREQSLADTA
ncbi:MAG: sugar phosphate nucleotidyltransferase [Nitrospinaceae bacterium]